ncbi:hypothetical protein BASA83_003852 [Batrachochytrium salamandrivorans]|nr:hypothetical protein BASA83_003852 [Batrachochytrium salamandrivorans]
MIFMRPVTMLLLPLLVGLSMVHAWDTEDHEIFDLQDALVSIDPKADFYSVLEVPRTAEQAEINKAYRKKSRTFHPDKTTDTKLHRLHTLLTSISTILKDDDKRLRYDGHLSRGFPTWRGTDYYYSRYKPGLVEVVVFILFFISVAQYIIAWIFYHRQKQEIETKIGYLNELSYVQLKKHYQKRTKDNGSGNGSGSDTAPSSPAFIKRALKTSTPLELLIASGDIDRSEFVAKKPSLFDVVLVQLPMWICTLIPRALSKSPPKKDSDEPETMADGSDNGTLSKDESGKSSARSSTIENIYRKKQAQARAAAMSAENSDVE